MTIDRLRFRMLALLNDPVFTGKIGKPDGGSTPIDQLAAIARLDILRLTQRQRQVMCWRAGGFTQTEISNALGIKPCTVSQTLHGVIYAGKHKGKRYGGVLWKLAGMVVARKDARDLLERIIEQDWSGSAAALRGEPPWRRWNGGA
jgi:DNA-binding CsgD family transcriptional regulator